MDMDMDNRTTTAMPGGHDMPGMHMTFFWGSQVQILFSGWPGNRGSDMYLIALLLVLATSALEESLSALSQRLSRSPDVQSPATGILLTAVHAVRMGLAYLVMLAVMSFNGGVLVAAVAGHALGFLVSRSGVLSHGSRGSYPDDFPSPKY